MYELGYYTEDAEMVKLGTAKTREGQNKYIMLCMSVTSVRYGFLR